MNKYLNHAKAAAITTIGVLLVIYAARKLPVVNQVTAPLVNKALNG